ncbi:protein FAM172A-like [Orbicella faveolata]|uniref:protein FAM172A-like n=1 Tax=Orbicella faveolata TaxID=48498 RepID=UPI0009E51F03|nr:protein FAM172A-like [Orbicella faveolata]
MRRELLLLIITIQISPIRTVKDTCDARSGNSCTQMSDSLEEEKDNMGQYLGTKEKKSVFPTTLEEFGYQFNKDGQLRNIETNEPFKFEVKEGDRAYNQKHYEALGEVHTMHYTKSFLPLTTLLQVDAKEDEVTSFIFMSDDAMMKDKLMILIHGSGVVRAGQWARRLIINNDLNRGTMLPYIKRASQEGFGVVITNGNENHIKNNKRRIPIRGSESPEKHFVYVWDNFISKAAAQSVVVVAHSYGGIVIVEGLQNCKGIEQRIKAVAFTDSVHSLAHQRADKKLVHWMKRNSRNWVSSGLPLDAPVSSLFKGADCEMVSAGTNQHELTSHVAFDSIFKFFEERLSQKDSSENQKDNSDREMDTSENQAGASQNEEDVSENQADVSENQADVSENQADASENQADASENQADASENQADASHNKKDSSQSQKDAPENQAEDSQMETDS